MLTNISRALAVTLLALAIIRPVPAQSVPDACTLLTADQISAVVGSKMGPGTYMTPTFKATCTWTAPGIIVTLMTETTSAFAAQKGSNLQGFKIVPTGGVGDDAFYVVVGNMASLMAKKGGNAFKMSVYSSKQPLDKLESWESALGAQVAGKL